MANFKDLTNYAGNDDSTRAFEMSDCKKKFSAYLEVIYRNFQMFNFITDLTYVNYMAPAIYTGPG